MDIPPLHRSVRAADLPLETLAANPNIPEKEKIGEAVRQFEAVLLRQILASARKTVIASGLHEDNATSDIYQDLFNTQLADAISRGGGMGLASCLQAQLTRTTEAHPGNITGELESEAR